MTGEDTAAILKREQAITTVCDHTTHAMLAQKFITDGLHDLAADNHDGLWTHAVLQGLDLLRTIAGVVQHQTNELWEYGTRDVPF